MDKKDTETFLDRWSRRKRQPHDAQPPETVSRTDQRQRDEAAEPEIDPATLPSIDELTAASDLSPFLQKGVPEHLKQLALRRAWSLDPVIRDFVEMAENQYDWNVPGGVPGFGELEAGTDIEALLAQAIGQEKPVSTLADVESRRDVASVGPGGPIGTPDTVATEPERAPEHEKERAEGTVYGGENAPTPEEAASPRRRHGGALPLPPEDRA